MLKTAVCSELLYENEDKGFFNFTYCMDCNNTTVYLDGKSTKFNGLFSSSIIIIVSADKCNSSISSDIGVEILSKKDKK